MRKISKKVSRSDFKIRIRQIAKSKHSAEMTVGTLVIIVLAIIVLVVVALGFGTGWSNLWQRIVGYFGGGVNVDSVKQACEYSCVTKASYDYCCVAKEVVFEKGKPKEKITCKSDESRIGLTPCQEFDCADICEDLICDDANKKAVGDVCVNGDDTLRTLDKNFKPLVVSSTKCCNSASASCKATTIVCTTLNLADCGNAKKVCEWN